MDTTCQDKENHNRIAREAERENVNHARAVDISQRHVEEVFRVAVDARRRVVDAERQYSEVRQNAALANSMVTGMSGTHYNMGSSAIDIHGAHREVNVAQRSEQHAQRSVENAQRELTRREAEAPCCTLTCSYCGITLFRR